MVNCQIVLTDFCLTFAVLGNILRWVSQSLSRGLPKIHSWTNQNSKILDLNLDLKLHVNVDNAEIRVIHHLFSSDMFVISASE